ncbi:hypothetical protein J3D43_005749 [Paenibacillus xylanexedens]|nr:hypothetical protein [Paenibacillus xylanexedens]
MPVFFAWFEKLSYQTLKLKDRIAWYGFNEMTTVLTRRDSNDIICMCKQIILEVI